MLVLHRVFRHQFSSNQRFYRNLLKKIYLKLYMAKNTPALGGYLIFFL
jgi:hypothetical protein